jgi:hypothetical protein
MRSTPSPGGAIVHTGTARDRRFLPKQQRQGGDCWGGAIRKILLCAAGRFDAGETMMTEET